jgi:hypothetical protein
MTIPLMTPSDDITDDPRIASLIRLIASLIRYNDLESKEEAQEESGWKLVHGDVFRPPPRAGLLAVYLGTGVQVHNGTSICAQMAPLIALIRCSSP